MEGINQDPYAKRAELYKPIAVEEPFDREDEKSELLTPSRRSFLIKAFVAADVVAGGALAKALTEHDGGGEASAATTGAPRQHEKHHGRERGLVRIAHMGALAGIRLSGMGAEYLNWHEKEPKLDHKGNMVGEQVKALPEYLEESFGDNLSNLWGTKNSRYPNKNNEILAKWEIASYKELLRTGQEKQTTLEDYISDTTNIVRDVEKAIDWTEVSRLYSLNQQQLDVLVSLASRIDGSLLAAYSMTEIVSSGIGAKEDALLFDMLLRTAGEEFINRIPAIHDSQMSFGPYQFTPYALDERVSLDAKPNEQGIIPITYTGASKINQAVAAGYKAPQTVFGLKTTKDHHTAAYLFSLHNLAEALKQVPVEGLAVLHEIPTQQLIEFISASHHEPHPARTGLYKYIQSAHQQNPSYGTNIPETLEKYATRSSTNYSTLMLIAANNNQPEPSVRAA
jgi:hypothetical protein